MGKTQKKKMTNFLVQGSILAVAGLICRLIGLIYRMFMIPSFGKEGLGYYDAAYSIYNIALIEISFSMSILELKTSDEYLQKSIINESVSTIGSFSVTYVINKFPKENFRNRK